MPRLNDRARARLIHFHLSGFKHLVIVKKLSQENILISKQGVLNIIKKYTSQGKISDQQRSGRKSIFTTEHYDFIDDLYYKDDETSAGEVRMLLKSNFGIEPSVPAIKRIRKKLGWVQNGAKYCQAVRPVNCFKRDLFARNCIDRNETFDDVIFTDESTIKLERHVRRCFRKKNAIKVKTESKTPIESSCLGLYI